MTEFGVESDRLRASAQLGPKRAPFVGRERELSAVLERLAAAERGEGGVVLISGEPGVGKSRLLAEIASRAGAGGWRVLTGRAYDIEGMPPYLPFVDVLREHFRDQSDDDMTAHVSPYLAPLIPGIRPDTLNPARSNSPPEPELERYRLFEGVCDLLLKVSRTRPNRGLLLALDDLHWADRSTLLLFMHLARRVAGSPVLAVGTYRSAEVAPDRPIFDALAELSRERLHARLHLIGFSLDETRAFLRRLSGVDAATGVLESIFEQTAGNPFFVEELVRHLGDEGRDLSEQTTDATAWGIPEGVRQVIAKRVLALSGDATRVLQAAAVLGDDCEGAPLASVAELSGSRLLDALDQVTGAGMLHEEGHRYRFSHPLVQRTIYDGLTIARREGLHLRAAKALEAGDSPQIHLSALAVHYRLAGAAGDAERAISYSIRAGEAANAVFAYSEATTHWRASLALMRERGTSPERTADVLERLGDLLCVTSLDHQKGIDCLEESLKIYRRIGQTEAAALVHVLLGRHLSTFYDAMDIEGAREHFRAAEAVLGQLGEAAHLSIYTGIASTAMWSVRTPEGLDASQRAMSLAPPNGAEFAHALALHAWHLAATGRLAEAQRLADQACEMANRLDDPVVAVIADWLRAQVSYLLGDPTDSARWFERQLSKSWLAQAPVQRRRLASMLAWARAFSGALSEARALLYDGDRTAPPERWADAGVKFWSGDWDQARIGLTEDAEERARNGDRHSAADDLWLLGRVQLSLGDAEHAEASFAYGLEVGTEGHLVFEIRARAELALLCAATGRTDEARGHVERCRDVLAQGEDWRGIAGRVAMAEGALAAAEGRLPEAERHLGRATEILRRVSLPWDEAEALRLWGHLLRQAHRRDDAVTKLTSSLDAYEKLCAAPAWIDPIAAERDALMKLSKASGTLTAAYPDGLSERETEVLKLIAGGKSNREIAEQLFVSARTVERHIANIYGKIAVHSRTQATAYAFAHGLLPPPRR
jgi:DNA-binding CsgD family transcriptional regulator